MLFAAHTRNSTGSGTLLAEIFSDPISASVSKNFAADVDWIETFALLYEKDTRNPAVHRSDADSF